MTVESYRLQGVDAFDIEFDRQLHLPPDVASESLAGYDGILAAKSWHKRNLGTPELPYRVLVPGLGVGTLACALAAYEQYLHTLEERQVEIDGFDIDHSAINFASTNFASINNSRYRARFYQADWDRQSTWDELAPGNYHLVLLNPPYLPEDEVVALDYSNVPERTMFGGQDGLDHFRTIFPMLPQLMDRTHGGEILFRFQTPGSTYTDKLKEIIASAFGEEGLDWPSGLFPSEGETSIKPDNLGRRRWISLGRIAVPGEVQYND